MTPYPHDLSWLHDVVPHSPLHVRSLEDVDELVEQGYVCEIIVKVRTSEGDTHYGYPLSHSHQLVNILAPIPNDFYPDGTLLVHDHYSVGIICSKRLHFFSSNRQPIRQITIYDDAHNERSIYLQL